MYFVYLLACILCTCVFEYLIGVFRVPVYCVHLLVCIFVPVYLSICLYVFWVTVYFVNLLACILCTCVFEHQPVYILVTYVFRASAGMYFVYPCILGYA